jgi:phosphate starvation-inducible PhoH-like protein
VPEVILSTKHNHATQESPKIPAIRRKTHIDIIPRNLSQETYTNYLLNEDIDICFGIGPAGTGKTLLATLAGIKQLKEGKVARIVITRPAVTVDDEKHGFLPGDLNQKMEPWTRPIFDVFEEYFTPAEIATMLEERVIEVAPLAYMRGRTFKHSWIIADEMQNATPGQMKMLLTRLGEGSKIVATGDIDQADRANNNNGLLDFQLRYSDDSSLIKLVQFAKKDIERHPVVEKILEIYGE